MTRKPRNIQNRNGMDLEQRGDWTEMTKPTRTEELERLLIQVELDSESHDRLREFLWENADLILELVRAAEHYSGDCDLESCPERICEVLRKWRTP